MIHCSTVILPEIIIFMSKICLFNLHTIQWHQSYW